MNFCIIIIDYSTAQIVNVGSYITVLQIINQNMANKNILRTLHITCLSSVGVSLIKEAKINLCRNCLIVEGHYALYVPVFIYTVWYSISACGAFFKNADFWLKSIAVAYCSIFVLHKQFRNIGKNYWEVLLRTLTWFNIDKILISFWDCVYLSYFKKDYS